MKISARTLSAVSGLLDQMLELLPAEREPWLKKLSESQPEMVPVLREMLAAREQSGFSQVLQTLPRIGSSAAEATATVATSALREGERVGPYQLKRELGAGGMAVVWLAQRADGAFKRDVALKLPMLSRLRRDLPDRFERERDILASLEHPNIARLYDAGVAEDGLPYLAMEFVEGRPITSWCDSHRYGIRERLKLFLQVLDAVQYAHARQVIHRDLKPSNILVTESGQVRLLDFGIAKLLIEGETAEETQLTQLYGRAFTVDYASPEQLRGESLTAASDIYALGVVLYELLTGSRPYQIKASTAALIEHAIVNAQIGKPSTRVGEEAAANRSNTQARLSKHLKGDLDTIVLKTLAKAPTERYSSAESLADELQRYLSGDPVEVRPARLRYRATMYLRQKMTELGVSAAILLLVAVAVPFGRWFTPGTLRVDAGESKKTDSVPVPKVALALVPISLTIAPLRAAGAGATEQRFADKVHHDLEAGIEAIRREVTLLGFAAPPSGGQAEQLVAARKSGARYVAEGDTQREGAGHSVSLRLIDATSAQQIWSTRVPLRTGDSSVLTSLPLRTLVTEFCDAIVDAETRRVSSVPPNLLNAEELTLRSATVLGTGLSLTAVIESNRLLDMALEKEPNSVSALIFRIFGWDHENDVGPNVDRARMASEMDVLSLRAVGLDPKDPSVWMARFLALADGGRWSAAEEALAQAGRLDPLWLAPVLDLAWVKNMIGRPGEALPLVQRALALSPEHPGVPMRMACEAHLLLGQAAKAIAECERAIALLPTEFYIHLFLAAAYANHGDMARAAAAREDALRRMPGYTVAQLKAKRYSENPEYLELAQKYWWEGMRRAGFPEQ